jgi:hypothetical protein
MPRPAARGPAARALVTRYAVAWAYLAGVTIAGVTYLLLPRAGQASVMRWASTNVHNLHQDPAGCLVASAFLPSGSVGAWPLLITLALFGASRVLGNWRTLVVCAAGHVIGTLVSEGIVAYRVSHGTLPRPTGSSSTSARPTWSWRPSRWPSCTAAGRPAPPR